MTTRKNSRQFTVLFIVQIGVLAALAAILMEFPKFKVPFMPSFLTLDFSDFPALLASFSMGPLSGVFVCLVKCLLHLTFSDTFGVGELSNFIIGASFVVPAGLIYRRMRTFKGALVSSFTGAAVSSVVGFIANLFIVYPLYNKIGMPYVAILNAYKAIMPSISSLAEAILIFNVPFTFVKGLFSVLIVFIIYKKVSPLLKKKT